MELRTGFENYFNLVYMSWSFDKTPCTYILRFLGPLGSLTNTSGYIFECLGFFY
jgi:hypothetical protein